MVIEMTLIEVVRKCVNLILHDDTHGKWMIILCTHKKFM